MREPRVSPRPAVASDLEQVAEIEAQSIVPPWTRSAFAAELEKKTSRFLVLTDDETDETVFAYAVLSFPAEQAHLLTFAVHPAHRRRGLATRFLRQLISYVIRQKGESIVLEVRKGNNAAVRLYQSLGFLVIHTLERFYPDGEAGYSMIYQVERESSLHQTAEENSGTEGESNGGKQNLN